MYTLVRSDTMLSSSVEAKFNQTEDTDITTMTETKIPAHSITEDLVVLNSTSDLMTAVHTPVGQQPLMLGDSNSDTTSNYFTKMLYFMPCLALSALKYFVISTLLVIFVCKLWEIYCINSRDKKSTLPLPAGRMGLPFVGEMLHFLVLGVSFQRARRKEFGDIYRTHLFGRPTIRVSGHKFIKKLLLGEGRIIETKWPYTTQVILGTDGIVNGSKATHDIIKKLALRVLSPRFMETYARSIQKSIRKHIAEWNCRGEIFLLKECKQLITRTMMTVLLGVDENDPDIQKYITSADHIINSILCIPLDFPNTAWRKGKKARQFIFDQMKMRLKTKMECSDEELFGYPNSISKYPTISSDEIAASSGHGDSVLVNIIKIARIEGQKFIELKNLQNLALEIIFAGTQSLQSSSSLLILHLSQNPEVLSKLQHEIRDNGLWNVGLEEIPYRIVNSLNYVSSAVNECLRVTPPIPGAIRLAKKTFELGGFQVPKGWQVMLSIRETHEIASGEDKPLKADHIPFDPEYFSCKKCCVGTDIKSNKEKSSSKKSFNSDSDRNTNQIDDCYDSVHACHNKNGPFSFIPFGKGSRMCAGVNYALFFLRVLAIEVARSSKFHLTTDIKLKHIPMTRPAATVKVKFSRSTMR